jgi:hypothetical protein
MAVNTQMVRVIRAQFPAASDVCLVGEFNNWSTAATPMIPVGSGVWEARLEASIHMPQIWFFVYDASRCFGRLVRGAPSEYAQPAA